MDLKVDCDASVPMLKRCCLDAFEGQALPSAPDMLMLCEGFPFPLTRSAGSHSRLNDGAVVSLIDRRSFQSDQVDYNKF